MAIFLNMGQIFILRAPLKPKMALLGDFFFKVFISLTKRNRLGLGWHLFPMIYHWTHVRLVSSPNLCPRGVGMGGQNVYSHHFWDFLYKRLNRFD